MVVQRNLDHFRAVLRQELPALALRFGVASFGLFGSYVRQENGADSDLDILVAFHRVPSLLRFIELENYLSDVLGVKVDLVMREALQPHIGRRILAEVVPV